MTKNLQKAEKNKIDKNEVTDDFFHVLKKIFSLKKFK